MKLRITGVRRLSQKKVEPKNTRISSLNCGSLRDKIEHIRKDDVMMISDVICLSETGLWEEEDKSKLELNGFKSHHLTEGKGKGLSMYFNVSKFKHSNDVKTQKIQMIKLTGTNFDIIGVYKAPSGNDAELRDLLKGLIEAGRSTLVCGDFNMRFIDNIKCRTTNFLIASKFNQLVSEATHLHGGHIDQVYLRSDDYVVATELHSPYYTAKDHDAICICLSETE